MISIKTTTIGPTVEMSAMVPFQVRSVTKWYWVMFSDKSHFCFSNDSCRVRVWHQRDDLTDPAVAVKHPTVRQCSIMG